MADDLNDEWWQCDDQPTEDSAATKVSDNEQANDEGDEITPTERPKESEQKVGKKRTAPVVETGKPPKSRKRPKKKRITEVALKRNGTSADEFRAAIDAFYEGKLSVVEKDALSLADEQLGPTNMDLSHTVASFLREALPKWQKISSSHTHKKAPLVIVVSSNANRMLRLNREAESFKGENCKTAKLFARHLKLEAQAKFLESHTVHFAIGTPARMAALLAQGSLTLDHTRLVMLDWNWRDVKMKRMTDIVDVQNSLMILIKDYIVPASKSHHVKIGVY